VCALDMGILNGDGVGCVGNSQLFCMYVTANFAGVFGIGDGKSGFSDGGVRVCDLRIKAKGFSLRSERQGHTRKGEEEGDRVRRKR